MGTKLGTTLGAGGVKVAGRISTDELIEKIRLVVDANDDICSIELVGSRARGEHGENSDWDLLVYLTDECYGGHDGVQEEKAVARVLHQDPVEVFFLRPNGDLARWGENAPMDGLLEGDWSRFWKHYRWYGHKAVLYRRWDDGEVEGAATSAGNWISARALREEASRSRTTARSVSE